MKIQIWAIQKNKKKLIFLNLQKILWTFQTSVHRIFKVLHLYNTRKSSKLCSELFKRQECGRERRIMVKDSPAHNRRIEHA